VNYSSVYSSNTDDRSTPVNGRTSFTGVLLLPFARAKGRIKKSANQKPKTTSNKVEANSKGDR
jgi:hypothetical protein